MIPVPGMEQKKISLKVLCIASIILVLFELLTALTVAYTEVYPIVAIGSARLVEIAVMILILLLWGNGLESIGLLGNKFITGLRKGLAWAVGFGVVTLLLLGVLYFLDYNILHLFKPGVRKSSAGALLLLLVAGLISPVAEEIFFRGIVYGYLRTWSLVLAILGSTTLFAVAHFVTSGNMLIQIIGGFVFAVAYEIEKNLLVPITIHVLGNLAILTLSIVLAL